MKSFAVKTIYPADATITANKQTTTKQVDELFEVEQAKVVELFDSYRAGDYAVSVKFTPPAEKADGDEEVSPFEVAAQLAKQGIDYKAALKIKSKGSYDDMLDVMHLIESEGFNMDVNVQLKVRNNTSINIDRVDTWTDEDAVFKVNPKATAKDINELKSLYDNLDKKGYEVEINITPKMPETDNMDDENDSFATQLAAYPENTLVTFRLKQA